MILVNNIPKSCVSPPITHASFVRGKHMLHQSHYQLYSLFAQDLFWNITRFQHIPSTSLYCGKSSSNICKRYSKFTSWYGHKNTNWIQVITKKLLLLLILFKWLRWDCLTRKPVSTFALLKVFECSGQERWLIYALNLCPPTHPVQGLALPVFQDPR